MLPVKRASGHSPGHCKECWNYPADNCGLRVATFNCKGRPQLHQNGQCNFAGSNNAWLSFGVTRGVETAVRAARCYVDNMQQSQLLLLDSCSILLPGSFIPIPSGRSLRSVKIMEWEKKITVPSNDELACFN
jgi:hypothetical protein